MIIFFVGLAIFVIGTVLNAAGWALHRRTVKADEPTINQWLVEVLRHWFGKLTGPDSTGGERLAAFGAILSAVGLVVTITGLGAWAAA